MAMAIVNCGGGYPFFAPSIFSYLCGVPLGDIAIGDEEVGNYETESLINEV